MYLPPLGLLCLSVRQFASSRDVKSSDRPRPRGQKTGLGLGLGLDGNGLGLGIGPETLWPRPRVVWPRGLVYCNAFISCSVATATVKSVIMKTKDGNVVNKARSGQGREKKLGNRVQPYRCYHLALVTVPRYHQLMPISCHFRDCKALLFKPL